MGRCTLGMARWFFLALFSPILAGCGGNTAAVTGKVTLDGQPVPNGQISFYPQDEQGTTAACDIKDGEYRIANLVPGKKKVIVMVNTGGQIAAQQPTGEVRRGSVKGERRGESRKLDTAAQAKSPKPLIGNNKVVDIVGGKQTLDFPLESPK